MMEKRALLAAALSILFLAVYSQTMTQWAQSKSPSPRRQPTIADTIPTPSLTAQSSGFFLHPIDKEEIVHASSPNIKVGVGATSAAVREVTLTKFLEGTKNRPIRFGTTLPLIWLRVDNNALKVISTTTATDKIVLEANDALNRKYRLSYEMVSDNPLFHIVLECISKENSGKEPNVALISTWLKGDVLSDRYNRLEAVTLSGYAGEKNEYKRIIGHLKADKSVPRGTKLVTLTERYFCQSVKTAIPGETRIIPSPEGTIAAETLLHASRPGVYEATVYVGPRDYFWLRRTGFSEAFPVGLLEQIGLILLLVLSWIAGVTHNYGVALVLFSALITGSMAPFTLLSIKSMKRMQVLKPHIDRLMTQHKNDPQKANKEIAALYKTHKVSPLGGCLPMLLQIPIFIALFQSISHFIELRGQSFLWIRDLSLPDRIAQLPVSLPLLGNEVNLLPVVMAAAMYLQTKMSQQNMGTSEANPTAQAMSGPLMPVLFFVMFYQFPSGLVLYWLTNSLMAILLYRISGRMYAEQPTAA